MNPTSPTDVSVKPLGPTARRVITWLEKRLIQAGVSRIELYIDGSESMMIGQFQSSTPIPCVNIHNPMALLRRGRQGLLGWAETYINGDWSSPDLKSLTDWAMANEEQLQEVMAGNWFSNLVNRLWHRIRHNSRHGSRRNIAAHYDLGNDFYRHWLDSSMTYSCALYFDQHDTLEVAQDNKYQTVIDWLSLSEGQSVLEIGCGWGGFARALELRHKGSYQGITLSKEQLAWAQAQQMTNPQMTCHFSLTDYRDVTGTFDHVVSIEMIEAVGEENWPAYFQKIHHSLKPGGSAVIQAIIIDNQRFKQYRNGVDFIQHYIFPGGMLPCDRAIKEYSSKAGLTLTNKLAFGLDYARTLEEWKKQFLAAWPAIEKLGFDQRFRRLWQFYLDYCTTGFQFRSIDVCLYRLTKPLEEPC